MKKIKEAINFLIEEFIIEPIRGAYNITQILRGKQEPPEWITTKWDIKQIIRDTWIIYLIAIICLCTGWQMATEVHEQTIIKEGKNLACKIVNDNTYNTICPNTNTTNTNYTWIQTPG